MGRSSRSSSSSVYSSGSSSSSWSRASGLSDVTERGIVTRTKDIGKMNHAQKFMAYTLGIRADSKKHHRVKAQILQWEGIDEEGRVVTWLDDNPELFWTTSARYHDDDEMRPRSKASSRSGRRRHHHHHRGPQGRQVPPPQVRPGPQMGPRGPFMPGGAGPGPMGPPPQHGGPPPPPQHFPPGPTPMPQPGAWGPPPGVPQEVYDDETASYSSGYDSDGGSYFDDGMYGQQPPPPPQQFQPGPPPPPPAAATSDTLDDGAAFIKL